MFEREGALNEALKTTLTQALWPTPDKVQPTLQQQQLAAATATAAARHARSQGMAARLLPPSSQARIGTGVPHRGTRGDHAGCWGREARRQLQRQNRQKGHRTCGNRTWVDAVLLVENVSRRALLPLLLPRQPRHEHTVGGVVKFATST